MSASVTLPWPPSGLGPNRARGLHWGKRAKLGKRYKRDCGLCCMEAGLRRVKARGASLTITFNPPDRQRRDLDNLLASIKHGLDAVSEAIGVDDSLFSIRISKGEPVNGGAVLVEIGEVGA